MYMDIVEEKQKYIDELQYRNTEMSSRVNQLIEENTCLKCELDKCKAESATDVVLDYETEYRREHEQLINARKVIKYLSSLL